MSKTRFVSSSLPPLQKRIVLALVESGPVTKNQLMKNLKSENYKPVWTALNSLIGKKMVDAVGDKMWRRRAFPTYWLTADGIMEALIHGAKIDSLEKIGCEVYPNEKFALKGIIEMAKIGGPARIHMLYEMCRPGEDGRLVLRAFPVPFDEAELVATASAIVKNASPELRNSLMKAVDKLRSELIKTTQRAAK